MQKRKNFAKAPALIHVALGFIAAGVLITGCSNPLFTKAQIAQAKDASPVIEITSADGEAVKTGTILDMGSLIRNAQAETILVVKNTGASKLIIDNNQLVPVGDAGFSVSSLDSPTIEIGKSVQLKLRFQPAEIGTFEARLLIKSNDLEHPEIAVTLKGNSVIEGAPLFTPNGGSFGSSPTITLNSSRMNARIFYTIDGSNPSHDAAGNATGSSVGGPSPVTIPAGTLPSGTTIIRAISWQNDTGDSSVTSANFHINGLAPAPAFSPASGSNLSLGNTTVTVTSAAGQIACTTDGSMPLLANVQPSPVSIPITSAMANAGMVTVRVLVHQTGYDDYVYTATYSIHGMLDASFGVGGLFQANNLAPDLLYYGGSSAIKCQPVSVGGSDYLLVSGSSSTGFTIARFNKNATATDSSFASGGVRYIDLRGGDSAYSGSELRSMAVDTNGNAFIGGISGSDTKANCKPVVIAKVKPDGSLDTSFGASGVYKSSQFAGGAPYWGGLDILSLDASGNVWALGRAVTSAVLVNSSWEFKGDKMRLLKLTSTGVPTSFNPDPGYCTTQAEKDSESDNIISFEYNANYGGFIACSNIYYKSGTNTYYRPAISFITTAGAIDTAKSAIADSTLTALSNQNSINSFLPISGTYFLTTGTDSRNTTGDGLISKYSYTGTPASLVSGFGNQGRVSAAQQPLLSGTIGYYAVICSGGTKFIYVSYSKMMRLNLSDCSVDTTFGTNGVVDLSTIITQKILTDVKVQADDSIILSYGRTVPDDWKPYLYRFVP